ncbi:MAG: vanadium-dependent haloperoxidase [Prochlorococcaceae cyanobacterium]
MAFDFVKAAVDAVAQEFVTIEGQSGPTVAARFYYMAGTALREADQLFDDTRHSSLLTRSGSRDDFARELSCLEKKVHKLSAGLCTQDQANFRQSIIAHTALNVLREEAPAAANLFEDAFAKNDTYGGSLQMQVDCISSRLARMITKVFNADGAAEAVALPYKPQNSGPDKVRVMDAWTPEYNVSDDPTSGLQSYLTFGWGDTEAIISDSRIDSLIGGVKLPEPFLLDPGATADLNARTITTADGTVLPISRELVGNLINPEFITQTERVIQVSAELTDEQKFIAEFFEDGPGTGFPPGTMMSFAQFAEEDRGLELEEATDLYFAMGAALHTAGVATWQQKGDTDYVRPVRAVRELSEVGLLGNAADVDPITGRSQFNAYSRNIFNTDLIDGTTWETYQNPSGGYSPPFAEYTSGHSTFSAAGARVLELAVGEKFGGEVTGRGVFEPVSENEIVTLKWDTWRDAGIDAGLSRIYGGIHFDDGNLEGQKLGALIGETTFEVVSQLSA